MIIFYYIQQDINFWLSWQTAWISRQLSLYPNTCTMNNHLILKKLICWEMGTNPLFIDRSNGRHVMLIYFICTYRSIVYSVIIIVINLCIICKTYWWILILFYLTVIFTSVDLVSTPYVLGLHLSLFEI